MIRFILRRRVANGDSGFDKSDLFTVDGDVAAVERHLRSGGYGPTGFDFCELVGVEVIDDAPAEVKP